jgi:hypothetical protein
MLLNICGYLSFGVRCCVYVCGYTPESYNTIAMQLHRNLTDESNDEILSLMMRSVNMHGEGAFAEGEPASKRCCF